MDNENLKRSRRVSQSLKESRRDYEPYFEQLEQHFMPRRGLFTAEPASKAASDRGGLLNGKILDSTPIRALRILKSGLHAGLTSPSRPWFRLQPQDPDLRERQGPKEYVAKAEFEMRRLAERSGLYNMLHTGYGDLGVYATECALIEDSGSYDLRGMQLTPGSYWLGMSDDRSIDTMHREFPMTVNQIVGKFVFKGQQYGEPDWGVVPARIKNMYDKGDIAKVETMCHLIMPRTDRDPVKADGRNKPIASQYWVKNDDRAADIQRLAGDLGYDENPISASRWEVTGCEVWGSHSPAMETLPDVKELMNKRRDYAESVRRMNRPTMNAHTDLYNSEFSLMTGAVNFMADPTKGLTPAFQINPDINGLRNDIEATQEAVWSGMYADLFMMISSLDRRQITATEIDERREEKLLGLGPVLERQHFEKHKPLVERLFRRVVSSGRLGPPPPELENEELEIDFISMLAQAQKAVATGSMERFAGYVGNLASVKPEVLDKFDEDQSVDEYANMVGVPPSTVRSDEEVDEIRRLRQEQIAAQQQAAMAVETTKAMQQGASAAKTLSEADGPRQEAPIDILNKTGLG